MCGTMASMGYASTSYSSSIAARRPLRAGLVHLLRPRRVPATVVAAAPRRRPSGSSGGSSGSGPDRPQRRPGGEGKRSSRPKPERVERPWPGGDLPSGQEEFEAAVELMAALGPAERAQIAEMMRGSVYEELIDGATEALAEAEKEAAAAGEAPANNTVLDEATMSQAMWDALRKRLEPDEAAALDKFFGPDWSDLPELDLQAFEARLGGLSDMERIALLGAIEKLDALQETVESLDDLAGATQADLEAWRARQASEAASRGDAAAGEGDTRREPYPGANPAMAAAIEVLQGGETILVDPKQEEAARKAAEAERAAALAAAEERARDRLATSAAFAAERGEAGGGIAGRAAAAANGRAWGDWGPRKSGANGKQKKGNDMDSRVDSMMKHVRAMQQGVQTWGPPPSRQFQVLKDIFVRLCELGSMDEATLEARRMKADDYAAAVDYLSEQLGALLADIDTITDVATRSTLLWMDAALADPQSGQLAVTPESLAAFGRFLGAAENVAALSRWARAFAENHTEVPMEDLLESSGLGAEDWFIRRNSRMAAATAAEAAAASGIPGSAVLGRFIDADRIEWLAALDLDNLLFMADIEVQGYSQDVLIKWSLHPTIGARLVSGDWYNESQLPDMLQLLMREAKQPQEGVDYDVRFPRR